MIANNDLCSNNISLNIYKLRITHGYTHEEIAEIMRVSTRTIYFWENGNKKPTIDNLIYLTRIFGVSIEEMLRK